MLILGLDLGKFNWKWPPNRPERSLPGRGGSSSLRPERSFLLAQANGLGNRTPTMSLALKGPFISIPHVALVPFRGRQGRETRASSALRSRTAATIHAIRPETIAFGDAPAACGYIREPRRRLIG